MNYAKGLFMLAATLVPLCVFAETPPETAQAVTLEYKLKPGQKLEYAVEGNAKQSMGGDKEAKFSGKAVALCGGVDLKTGNLLMAIQANINSSEAAGGAKTEKAEASVSVFRMDKNGQTIPREMKKSAEGAEPQNQFLKFMLASLAPSPRIEPPWPGHPVKAGDKWEGSLAWFIFPVKMKFAATLTAVKKVEGQDNAFIKTTFSPDTSDSAAPIPIDLNNFTAEAESVFNIERGVLMESKVKIALSLPGEQKMEAALSYKFSALSDSPPEEAARNSARIKALDGAIDLFFAGEIDKGIEDLQKQRMAEKDEQWQQGIDSLLSTAQNLQRFGNAGAGMAEEDAQPAGPEQKLFATAAAQAAEGKWKEAAASYQSLATQYPDHELAALALESAARIHEQNLNDRPAAEAARKALVALREKPAAKEGKTDPLETYKLASSYAEAGDSQKAAEAYRKFLASDCKDAKMRVLAQYRLGGLLEKLNQTKEAADAYRAAEAIQTDDNYAAQIKEKAKQRAAELSKGK